MLTQRSAIRLAYFGSIGAMGSFLPFVALILIERGCSPSQIGQIMLLMPLAGVFMPPVLGGLADRFQAAKKLLLGMTVGTAALASLFLLVKEPLWTILAFAAYSVWRSPTHPLLDSIAHQVPGLRAEDFGSVRLFGSLGFGILVALVGALGGAKSPMLILAVSVAAYSIASLGVVSLEPASHRWESERGAFFSQAWNVCRQPMLLLLLSGSMIYYAGHSVYDVCYPLHLQRLGLGNEFLGASMGVAVAAEVAIMWFARRWIGEMKSQRSLVLAGLLGALRWAILGMTDSSTAILASQLLHGVTFGLWYLAVVNVAQEIAPPHLRTSVQAGVMMAMSGGRIVGYVAGTAAFEHLGVRSMWLAASLCSVLGTVVYIFLRRVSFREG